MTARRFFFRIVLFLGMASASTVYPLTLGYVHFPPYEFESDGVPKGILVAVVGSVFKKAGIPLTLTYLPFKRAYENVRTGEIDGIFNFYKSDERLKLFDYSEPIIRSPLVFFAVKKSPITFSDLEDLKGKRVGVMLGYSYGSEFDKSDWLDRSYATSHEGNFMKLVRGRIDVYLCDKLVGIHVAKKEGFFVDLKILPKPLAVMDGFIGFTKGKHSAVIERINRVILDLHRSGEIQQTIDAHVGIGR